jgi:hypothetical protein
MSLFTRKNKNKTKNNKKNKNKTKSNLKKEHNNEINVLRQKYYNTLKRKDFNALMNAFKRYEKNINNNN